MKETLYPLGVKDVEAVARSRANLSLPNNIKYFMYAGVIVAFVGVLFCFWNQMVIGIGVAVVGLVVLWTGTIKANNRRNNIVRKYRVDWKEEQLKTAVK